MTSALPFLCPCGSGTHPWRHYLKLSTKLFYFALVAFSRRIYLPDNKNLLFHEGRMGSGEDGGMGEIMECVEKTVQRRRRRSRRRRLPVEEGSKGTSIKEGRSVGS